MKEYKHYQIFNNFENFVKFTMKLQSQKIGYTVKTGDYPTAWVKVMYNDGFDPFKEIEEEEED